MRKLMLLLLAFVFIGMQVDAQKTVTGTVTSADDGSTLPGVSVVVKGTNVGTVTDVNGQYSLSVPEGSTTLVFSFVGMKTLELPITGDVVNAVLEAEDVAIEEVVVTALGIKREEKTLPYSAQQVKEEKLNMTQDANIKTAIAGKVAGVQIVGQAGSKLGSSGKIRIRGTVSMTSDSDPLYVVDGVPGVDPNAIDIDNIASINVLKGPNATALYGQRAEFGVVVITTKKAAKGIGVEFTSAVTWDKVAYLPNYQNIYGEGYSGEGAIDTFHYVAGQYPEEWAVFDGKIFNKETYADESWGPKLDGRDIIPWYAWWKSDDNPYFGKTVPYSPQPDNIKNFYDTGITLKNGIALNGGNDKFNARLSYTNLRQNGILPFTYLKKNFVSTNFQYNVTDKFKVSANINFTTSKVHGDFDDGYANQTSGSFNQWFARDLDTKIERELKDLTTPDGYLATWNWWGPNIYRYGYLYPAYESYKKPVFWFNHYTWLDRYDTGNESTRLIGNIVLSYEFSKNLTWEVSASRNQLNYHSEFHMPYSISYSGSADLYLPLANSFGVNNSTSAENNYSTNLRYRNKFGNIDVDAFVGGNIRYTTYNRARTWMDWGDATAGLIMPDVYLFSNAAKTPTTQTYFSRKQVNSMYGHVSVGYAGMLYLDASYRQDWSSALPADHNGYGYPSVGVSFIFSELLPSKKILSFGKLRASWAQVGNDLAAYAIAPTYPIGGKPYTTAGGNVLALNYEHSQLVDPNIKPALNTSMEAGFDLKFMNNRFGVSFTAYKEVRKDEIIGISISRTTGFNSYLTNAGKSERQGIEIAWMATPVKTKAFTWDVNINFGKNSSKIVELPAGLESMAAPGGTSAFGFVSVIHELDNTWGQLRGAKIKRTDDGTPVLTPSGLYVVEPSQFLGSILPDFTGGILNTFSFFGVSVSALVDFQKGGKFFSLTEQWGTYSGLLAETAAINDNGKNVRDDVADGGGVHVTGVTEDGQTVDTYVPADVYYGQWYSNKLAEPFIHDASYIKLREVSVSYTLPKFNVKFVKGVTVGLIARNVALLSVAKDNIHGWDPSELGRAYGEDGQLPGTRSFGFNIKLKF